jgi:hypothetical protein
MRCARSSQGSFTSHFAPAACLHELTLKSHSITNYHGMHDAKGCSQALPGGDLATTCMQ